MKSSSTLVAALMLVNAVNGFTTTQFSSGQQPASCLLAANSEEVNEQSSIHISSSMSRATFLSVAAAAAASVPVAAFAKEDPALKGTKKDPEFETCLSKCMYECTKPKGVEQKSRKECLPDCKKECATNKGQLLLGTPTKKE
mmetsp:Transcript_3812/g.5036  ORF Transcript_3812/g.5036 Transcript_3812/m.5036 type:complete len:142 (+) Transcript_3812:106-531(+)|eukprot:CAMPEP_0198145674 /NCGR_PEP_ID=MMETSP1443-20131203/24838_1 /TAXON_ID=186043 /ORGANISM="Entomoneis sp., Strain CCMP2396" /LENGTH=141 /DNA_ID=CAMNT_0043809375 /DNA_START=77 /DNA_END=502 /DNA_ORIENTATION=+